MRDFPDGIRARRGSSADIAAWTSIMDEGLAGYASFTPPGWRPPKVSDETKQALAARFDGPDAWGLLALADDEPAGIVSISRIIRADVHPAPPGSAYVWQMFVRPAWQGSGLA